MTTTRLPPANVDDPWLAVEGSVYAHKFALGCAYSLCKKFNALRAAGAASCANDELSRRGRVYRPYCEACKVMNESRWLSAYGG